MMAYRYKTTKQFDKDVKRCQKRGFPMEKLVQVVMLLVENGKLPKEYRPHKLSGSYAGTWECHIQPDWLLLWQQDDKELVMLMNNTGTHSDLFK